MMLLFAGFALAEQWADVYAVSRNWEVQGAKVNVTGGLSCESSVAKGWYGLAADGEINHPDCIGVHW